MASTAWLRPRRTVLMGGAGVVTPSARALGRLRSLRGSLAPGEGGAEAKTWELGTSYFALRPWCVCGRLNCQLCVGT